jgi:hypothetical protein
MTHAGQDRQRATWDGEGEIRRMFRPDEFARYRSSGGCCIRDVMSPNFPRGHSLQETRGGPIISRLLDHAEQNWPQLAQSPGQIPRQLRLHHRRAPQLRADPAVPAPLRRLRQLVRLRDLLSRQTATKTHSCARIPPDAEPGCPPRDPRARCMPAAAPDRLPPPSAPSPVRAWRWRGSPGWQD